MFKSASARLGDYVLKKLKTFLKEAKERIKLLTIVIPNGI
jgi:hypothetical protein